MSYLSGAQVNAARLWLPRYSWAMQRVGLVEVMALAAIHYRESEFGDHGDPGTSEGPFGCDQGGDGQQALDNIVAFAQKVAGFHGYIPPDGLFDLEVDSNLAVLCCAHEFKSKIRIAPIPVPLPEDMLADALWGYNGRSSHHNELEQTGQGSPDRDWRWSPYVSNDPENGRILNIVATEPDPSTPGGRRTITTPDRRPGALFIYRELKTKLA